jgi:hypothetical protein
MSVSQTPSPSIADEPATFRGQWRWVGSMADRLRLPFAGSSEIKENYSQAWQDIFILSVLDGMKSGRYLEVGAQKAASFNNTYLLHRDFHWSGVSLELDPTYMHEWRLLRPDSCLVVADALSINYVEAMPRWFGEQPRRIDYLQLDIEPSYHTLQALKRLPLDLYRFSVITFETDAYSGDFRARDESRDILKAHGYELVVRDVVVPFPHPVPFEDWWVDPQVVDGEKIEQFKAINPLHPWAQDVLFHTPIKKV